MKVVSLVLYIISAVLFFFGAIGLLFLGNLGAAFEVEASWLVSLLGILYFGAMVATIYGAVKAGKKEGTLAGLISLAVILFNIIAFGGLPWLLILVTGGATFASYAEQKKLFS